MIASHLYLTTAPDRSDHIPSPEAKHQIILMLPDRNEQDDLAGYIGGVADIFFARNEREVMDILRSRPVHLVIANGSGGDHGLCWSIKSCSLYAHIPVVELISRDSVNARLQCLESGVDAWLERPVSRHILLAQIDNLMINRARIRSHFAAAGNAEPLIISPSLRKDETLWKKLNQVIMLHLSDTGLDIRLLARQLYMSRTTLYRKIAAMSNMSPSELITLVRLNNAASLLVSPGLPIGDVVRMVGFTTRSGFGKAFFRRFRMTPSAYREKAIGQNMVEIRQPAILSRI